ncbi:MAG: hypothetical protein KatS3mg052_0547 [Candidatus Roseilinea sp.]|nr:MAG: hypothetical protein KatS3mg052_0547 [Candidatus Roseilinea sp.]
MVTTLRDHGRAIRPDSKRAKYEHDQVGYGERLDTLQAAVLRVKLRHLPDWTARRQVIAQRYLELLADMPIGLPFVPTDREPVWHLFVIRVPHRAEVQAYLAAQGIETGIHYPIPLHLQKSFAGLGYRAGDLPHTEAAAQEVLSLPIYPELSEAQQECVACALRTAIRERAKQP